MAIDKVNVLNGASNATIAMTGLSGGKMPIATANTGFTRNLGSDLSNDHPISFTYNSALALADGELRTPDGSTVANRVAGAAKPKMPLENNQVQCATCHDPHLRDRSTGNGNAKFLRMNRFQVNQPTGAAFNTSSDIICLACHDKGGSAWAFSAHANSNVATQAYTAAAAQQRFGLRIGINDLPGGLGDEKRRVAQVLEYLAVLVLRGAHGVLGLPLFALRLGLVQRAVYGRHQPSQVLLEHIIGRPRLQALDRALLADGAGDKDEGDFRLQLLRRPQRLGAAVGGHRIIAENQIQVQREHRGLKLRLVPGRNDLAVYAAPGQRRGHQLAVPRFIFQVDDPELGRGESGVHGVPGLGKSSGGSSLRSAQKAPKRLTATANSGKLTGLTT
jgi:hypothetical protein